MVMSKNTLLISIIQFIYIYIYIFVKASPVRVQWTEVLKCKAIQAFSVIGPSS